MTQAMAQAGTISVPSFISENMVLQREVPVPIWGWGNEGDDISVQCAGQTVKTVVKDGKWRVILAPMKAGGPYTLLIMNKNISDTLLFSQVLVGEVWIVCGQSNALMSVMDSEASAAKEAVENRFKYPNIRVAQMGRRDAHILTTPQTSTEGYWGPVKWEQATYTIPRNNTIDIPGGTSAVSYYFARELAKYLGSQMPIGMLEIMAILPVESWIDDDTVTQTPEIAALRGKEYPNATSRAFDANIAPIVPFPVRGVIYYQGEMNSGRGKEYRAALPALISSWRKAWQNPDMPFLIVQLPGFIMQRAANDPRLDMDAATLAQFAKENSEHGYCGIREAQLMTWQQVPHTGMAITIDLGDPYNIHPLRKLPVAQRLFLQARQLVYGEKDLLASGPVPDKFTQQDNTFVVHFQYTGSGLVSEKDQLTGFELSADGVTFQPAQARIVGETVVVSRADMPHPKALRYAWAGYPQYSLYNKESLPATPFRYPTD